MTPILIAAALVMAFVAFERWTTWREQQLQDQLDRRIARRLASEGVPAEVIADEIGRPAADVRRWVEE